MSEKNKWDTDKHSVGERDAYIISKTKQGWSCRKIAENLEVTRARVNQIQKEYGIEPDPEYDVKFTNKDIVANLQAYYEKTGKVPKTSTWDGKPSKSTICNRFGDWSTALTAAGLKPDTSRYKTYTDEELIDMLQKANEIYDYPSSLKIKQDDRFPSYQTYYERFGSFSEALQAAGIEPRYKIDSEKRSENRKYKYTDEALIDMMESFIREIERKPMREEVDQNEDMPHSNTYVRRFDSWTQAVNLAFFEIK